MTDKGLGRKGDQDGVNIQVLLRCRCASSWQPRAAALTCVCLVSTSVNCKMPARSEVCLVQLKTTKVSPILCRPQAAGDAGRRVTYSEHDASVTIPVGSSTRKFTFDRVCQLSLCTRLCSSTFKTASSADGGVTASLDVQVFGDKTTQGKLYDEAIQPVVREVLAGFNCTIFAYGQTGTGPYSPHFELPLADYEERGRPKVLQAGVSRTCHACRKDIHNGGWNA